MTSGIGKDGYGKGSVQRPMNISQAEYHLRWKLAFGKITFKQFEKRLKELRAMKNEA